MFWLFEFSVCVYVRVGLNILETGETCCLSVSAGDCLCRGLFLWKGIDQVMFMLV